MRLALTAGGTGGHIFPALSVLQALRRRPGAVSEVCFFGPEDRGERTMVESHGMRFVSVPSGQVRGRGPLALGRSIVRLAWGTLVALRRLRAFRPDAVFSTGGYGSFPASLAARLLRKPLIVYLPDVRPGWAVKAEMRLATRMATTAEAALSASARSTLPVTWRMWRNGARRPRPSKMAPLIAEAPWLAPAIRRTRASGAIPRTFRAAARSRVKNSSRTG